MFWCYFKTYFSIRDEQILFPSVLNCGLINDIKVDLLNETNWIDSSEIIWTRMETFLNRIETKTVDKLLECSYQLSLGRWGTGQFIWVKCFILMHFGGKKCDIVRSSACAFSNSKTIDYEWGLKRSSLVPNSSQKLCFSFKFNLKALFFFSFTVKDSRMRDTEL